MSNVTFDRLPRLCLGMLGTVTVLSCGACGSVGVSNGTATASSSGGGEGVASGNGAATLTWTPVTQNTDGTLVMDLAGYKIFYGHSMSEMNTVEILPDPTVTTFVVTNLPSGTWYFTVSAYTSGGVQGAMSNVGTKSIN